MFPLLLVLMIWGLPGFASAADHTTDSLDTVKQKVKEQQALLVDVREVKEWDEGHLADARLSPLSQLQNEAELAKQLKNLPKDKIIYCHCL
ncbi:MAG: rhodanese-like domain-containing protein, partial [Planctomycetaceae bacterium]